MFKTDNNIFWTFESWTIKWCLKSANVPQRVDISVNNDRFILRHKCVHNKYRLQIIQYRSSSTWEPKSIGRWRHSMSTSATSLQTAVFGRFVIDWFTNWHIFNNCYSAGFEKPQIGCLCPLYLKWYGTYRLAIPRNKNDSGCQKENMLDFIFRNII